MRTSMRAGNKEIAINEYIATRFEIPLQISVQKKINGSCEIKTAVEPNDLTISGKVECVMENAEGNVI